MHRFEFTSIKKEKNLIKNNIDFKKILNAILYKNIKSILW